MTPEKYEIEILCQKYSRMSVKTTGVFNDALHSRFAFFCEAKNYNFTIFFYVLKIAVGNQNNLIS